MTNSFRKKIVLIGGLGTIGRILEKGLKNTYKLLILDIAEPTEINMKNYRKADVVNIDQLLATIPDDTHAIVNLSALSEQPSILNEKSIRHCSDVYVVGAYNVLLAAERKKIKKVVIASTNHVTGVYETNGISSLGREIKTNDYPLPDSAYGAMKLCAELFGYTFYREKNISVICLRIGTVVEEELSHLRSSDRLRRTILSKIDTVEIFKRAIESNRKYGVYYAVSDNPGKPWDLSNTISELGFYPQTNSLELLKGENDTYNQKKRTLKNFIPRFLKRQIKRIVSG